MAPAAARAESRAPAPGARPWYAQPLLWAVLSPLLLTVAAGIWLMITATELGGVDALPGEYGKAGKLIALDEAALQRSAALAPRARVRLDRAVGRFNLVIDGDGLPDTLEVRLIHATLPARDVTLEAVWTGDRWSAELPDALPDRGELHVHPTDRAWRLVAPIAYDAELRFGPSRR